MQALDLVGPMEVFTGAARAVPGAYEVRVAAPGDGGLGTSSGLTILPPGDVPAAGIDTLYLGADHPSSIYLGTVSPAPAS